MPAQAGIHDFAANNKGKSWMPTFVGMTRWVSPTSQSLGLLVLP
jgi:hypothetical protein